MKNTQVEASYAALYKDFLDRPDESERFALPRRVVEIVESMYREISPVELEHTKIRTYHDQMVAEKNNKRR